MAAETTVEVPTTREREFAAAMVEMETLKHRPGCIAPTYRDGACCCDFNNRRRAAISRGDAALAAMIAAVRNSPAEVAP
jgi:hypothetical protein